MPKSGKDTSRKLQINAPYEWIQNSHFHHNTNELNPATDYSIAYWDMFRECKVGATFKQQATDTPYKQNKNKTHSPQSLQIKASDKVQHHFMVNS